MKISPRLTWAIRGALTAAFVCIILLKVGPDRILQVFEHMDTGPVVFALVLGIPRFGIKILRWKILAGCAVPDIEWKQATESLFVGTAGAVITPGRIGQVTSSLLFPRDRRVILSGLALIDPLSDLMIVGLMVVFVITEWWLGIAATAIAVSAVFIAKQLGSLLSKQSGKIASAGNAVLLVNPWTFLAVGLLSVIIYFFNLIQFYLFLNAIYAVSFSVAAQSLPLIFLAAAIPFTIAGFGVREAMAALVLSKHGIPPEIGVQASFGLFIINLLIPAIIGAILFHRIKMGNSTQNSGKIPQETGYK